MEALVKLLKAQIKNHSGQAKSNPESRIIKQFWIPATLENPPYRTFSSIRGCPAPNRGMGNFAGIKGQVTFARTPMSRKYPKPFSPIKTISYPFDSKDLNSFDRV
jgi:hypothetical protein